MLIVEVINTNNYSVSLIGDNSLTIEIDDQNIITGTPNRQDINIEVQDDGTIKTTLAS